MRELAQVVVYHVRFDFHLVGALAAVEAHHAAHKLEHAPDPQECLTTVGFSPGSSFLTSRRYSSGEGCLPAGGWLLVVGWCSAASAAPPTGPHLAQVQDKVGELGECPFLLCFHSFYS